MTIHTMWPTRVMVQDNLLPPAEHARVKEYLIDQYATQQKLPLLEFNHNDPPPQLKVATTLFLAAATEYILADNQDPAMFELNNFQTHSVGRYNERLANEHIMEPHHDMMEGGYYAMLYYVNVQHRVDEYVGGTLAIYRNQTSMDYPDGILHVTPIENRFVMFPAHLVHRIKPYFSDNPRITIATLMRKERSHNQNQTIRTL